MDNLLEDLNIGSIMRDIGEATGLTGFELVLTTVVSLCTIIAVGRLDKITNVIMSNKNERRRIDNEHQIRLLELQNFNENRRRKRSA